MSDYDPILHALEIESQRRHQMVRQICIEAGRPDVLAEYDEATRLLRLGITTARDCWHSISRAQRSALAGAKHWGGRIARRPDSPRCFGFCVNGGVTGTLFPIRLATVRALCAHELMAWDGGAFEPESAAVVTERGHFVLKHGPIETAPHGHSPERGVEGIAQRG